MALKACDALRPIGRLDVIEHAVLEIGEDVATA
jgi:hypothetical protein